MRHKQGFTLIELLVVIAIIGILSAVVLVALGLARGKGNDTGVRANIDTVLTQAAIYQGTNSTFGTLDNGSGGATTCPAPGTTGSSVFSDPTIEKALAAAVADSSGGRAFCYSTPTGYAVAVSRPAAVAPSTSYFWCADSTGTKCGNDGQGGDGETPIAGGACVSCTVTQ